MKEKESNYLFLLLIISGICSFIWLNYYTIPNETIDFHSLTQTEYLNLLYLNNHPKFNYLHGLWLMFVGIMIFCVIAILELPDKFNELKQELITFIYFKVIHILGEKKYVKRKKNTKKS